ncbi:MAG: twin-arginine translocase TatA/TatE family subunit [Coriobacteriia bacterium]|nr:twin-arginine translocase TatA/TatE family subunit [Coriobacteriia bacterium]
MGVQPLAIGPIFGLGPMELGIILLIVLVLFGPKRLPQLGKSIGKTVKAIRDGVDKDVEDEDEDEGEVPAPKKKKAAAADEDENEE